MFAVILSDLGGELVGGMGMEPCSDIGLSLEPAHGSAPGIMGKDLVNPTGMFLSATMMLDWLGNRHQNIFLLIAGKFLEMAVEEVFRSGKTKPR